jgi:integrase
MRVSALTGLPFGKAAEIWLETRHPYISEKTRREYAMNLRTLAAFFGEMRLPEISSDQIRAYQRARMASCGPSGINHETSCLQQMLKRIGRWPDIAGDFQPLPLPKASRGRALNEEEYARLFQVAARNHNWYAAYLFAVISVNTTAGPKEVATLHLSDVDADLIRVHPEGAKNAYRLRSIPLNDPAQKAIHAAIARARELGSNQPSHYLFPFRIHRNNYDPARHQTSFRQAWRQVIKAADLPGLRMYDLRHHAITVLLENPDVSEETVEAIAGHISPAMKKRYAHIRIEARREAVMALVQRSLPEKKPPRAALAEELLDTVVRLLKKA